jgi:ankyrin repeat protein
MAASEGSLVLLQESLKSLNLPVSCADESGYTLLHAAAAYHQLSVMDWLLLQQERININAVDNDGDTALHYTERADVARKLIEAGANPTIANNSDKTALQVKQEELDELIQEDEDDDSDDVMNLRELIAYLTSVRTSQGGQQQ